jgi:MFS family permease
MDLFGLKWTILIGEIGYIFYIAANIKPLPIFMYISMLIQTNYLNPSRLNSKTTLECLDNDRVSFLGAALVGLAAAPLWTAKATYLNQIARYHCQHKKQNHDISVSLFFGIFFAIFGTSTIWGNLISYFVLSQSGAAQVNNCGVYYNPKDISPSNATQDVTDTTVR